MKICTGRFFAFFFLCISTMSLPAQQPVRKFTDSSYSKEYYLQLQKEFGVNKQIPLLYRKQLLIALSYFPELRQTSIEFRIRHAYTPLETTIKPLSIIQISTPRQYIITLSDSSEQALTPILFRNLDFNAQIGVIGHELSHVADFSSRNLISLICLGIDHLSEKATDHFEFSTDSICIAHGLGYQLLAWSYFVRKALHTEFWEGADNIHRPIMTRERYMNPGTILNKMKKNPAYLHQD